MLKSIEILKEAENYFRDVGYPAYAERISKASKAIAEEVEREYIALPKDANGETINLGDKLTSGTYWEEPTEVYSIDFTQDGIDVWSRHEGNRETSACVHYRKPTVEDVLFELLEKAVGHNAAHTDLAQDVVGDFAKRLQLKEDE